MKGCDRNLDEHCCGWGKYGTCKYLEKDTQKGFKWTCGLMRKYGTWEKVYATKEYKIDIVPLWDIFKERLGINNCGDFTCENCIEDGNA